MLKRTFVSTVLVFTSLGWAMTAQAAVVPAVGAMQGTTLFASPNGHVEPSLPLTSLAGAGAVQIHPVLGTTARPVAAVAAEDDHSKLYAMMGLGLLGFTVIRRKRYGRK